MDISLAGRIVSVADAFDVMTAARSYKKPFPAAQARVELTDNAGSQFDPQIVRAFLAISVGELRRVMGPVAWLAALPELVRASVTGALAPARTAVIAAGLAAASLVPAVSAPLHVVITPAADAASGAASTFAAAEEATNGASKSGDDASTAVPATESATGGAPTDGTATAATVTMPHDTSTTTSPTTRPVTGTTSAAGGGGSGPAQPDVGTPVTVAPVTAPSTTTTTTTPHTPVAASFTVTAHLNIKLSVDLQGGQTPKVTDADNNISWSTLTVTGRSAAAAGDIITARTNGQIDFTGPALVMGATWFDYRICDTTNRCATARVTVNLVSP